MAENRERRERSKGVFLKQKDIHNVRVRVLPCTQVCRVIGGRRVCASRQLVLVWSAVRPLWCVWSVYRTQWPLAVVELAGGVRLRVKVRAPFAVLADC
eukprot:scaffold2860_cov106-Isochrysis_galbana.AAC.10